MRSEGGTIDMETRMIFAGFGGQGVQSLGQMITYAGMVEGKNVSWLPSYGPEMRGGTTNCHVIVADEPVGAPILATADAILVMNAPSFDKFEPMVEKGGLIVVNASLIERKAVRDDIDVVYVPANEIAMELGNIRTAGMVALGAFLKKTNVVTSENVLHAIPKVLGEGKEKLVAINEKALARGAELVK